MPAHFMVRMSMVNKPLVDSTQAGRILITLAARFNCQQRLYIVNTPKLSQARLIKSSMTSLTISALSVRTIKHLNRAFQWQCSPFFLSVESGSVTPCARLQDVITSDLRP